MDKKADIIEKLKKLNNPQIGSLGEFIFESEFQNKRLLKKHANRTDFMLNEISLDIKTSRRFTNYTGKILSYPGKKFNNIKYPYIQFYNSTVICTLDDQILFKLNYDQIFSYLEDWSKDKTISKNQSFNPDLVKLEKIKNQLRSHFYKIGYETRIIYRTTQHSFGNESPANLIPSSKKVNRVTIFINFHSFSFEEKNIKNIYVIKEGEMDHLPKINNPRLHKEKIDLKLMRHFRYNSVIDVITNWS